MLKKIIYLFALVFFVASCADITRGLTGQKKVTTDEFLIKKKDPLILPPNYEELPTPYERTAATEELSTFEKTLGISIEDNSSSSSSVEDSILKKIRSK